MLLLSVLIEFVVLYVVRGVGPCGLRRLVVRAGTNSGSYSNSTQEVQSMMYTVADLSDVMVSEEKDFYLVTPQTQRAADWLNENVEGETSWFGAALVVEQHELQDLLTNMREDDISIEDGQREEEAVLAFREGGTQ